MKLAVAVLALTTAACAAQTAELPPPAPIPMPVSTATTLGPPPPPPPPAVSAGAQWLYGSGEGAASSLQAYRAFRNYVEAAIAKRPAESVVLAEGSNLTAPRWVPCGNKPFAIILDSDETAIQNLGLQYGLAATGATSDRALLKTWQSRARTQVRAMPGAVEAVAAIRAKGVTVIFNSNRDDEVAEAMAATLESAGLGRPVHGETLFLRGDVAGESGKDGRRRLIASRHCVVAMIGDQLGDFTDLLNDEGLAPLQRRAAASAGSIGALWGNGWFLLSNPVYGPGLEGTIDEVFEPAVRWPGTDQ